MRTSRWPTASGPCDHLTADDAAFVALAEALDAPLITCDARLAKAPGVNTELYPPT